MGRQGKVLLVPERGTHKTGTSDMMILLFFAISVGNAFAVRKLYADGWAFIVRDSQFLVEFRNDRRMI
jgi:hypothetical protein